MSGVLDYALGGAVMVTVDQAPFILGPIVFAGHEIPSRISIGGAHAVAIHRLPGGARVIDAMGVDDGAISWSGYFTGPTSTARARLVDAIRRAGEPVGLSFGDYGFTVIVIHFEYDLQDRGAVTSYRILTEIIPDTQPTIDITSAAALASLSSDIVSAGSVIPALGSSDWQAALSAVSGAIATPGDPAAPSKVTAIASSLQVASNVLQEEILRSTSQLADAAASGSTGTLNASTLAAAMQGSQDLAIAVRAVGYINRSTNWLSQLSGQASGVLPIYA